jgi:Thioredoxin
MGIENSNDEPYILSDEEIMGLKNKHGVVLFFMNGCYHCNVMKPNWNKVVKELKKSHSKDFILGAIESSDMERFNKAGLSTNISGYPTILYFPHGISKHADMYDGNRSAEDLKKWITSKMGHKKGGQSGGAKRKKTRRASNGNKKKSMRHLKRKSIRHHRKTTYRRRH